MRLFLSTALVTLLTSGFVATASIPYNPRSIDNLANHKPMSKAAIEDALDYLDLPAPWEKVKREIRYLEE
jgi:hypothetical protein